MKLNQQKVFFLDLQTTGAKPETSSILELAFNDKSFLIKQNEPLPRRITMVTGINDEDLESAHDFDYVINEFKSFLQENKNAVCIIHFAQFERPFLKTLFEEIPFPIICTNEIAKRLYPNLPSRGIKALSGFFGDNTGDFKRATCHVNATIRIWENMIVELEKINVTSLDELTNWLSATPKAKKTKYEYPLPKEKRLNLPDVPGIYRMINLKGEVLYVGKATSLHHRVNSYFRGQKNRDAFKLEMLTQVYDLRVTECSSPLEAALLETDEIKRLNPYYNIALKVEGRAIFFFDKDFVSMSSTPDDIHVIGPFSSALVFESMMKLLDFISSGEELPSSTLFFEEMEPELIKAGLLEFCVRHSLDLKNLTMRKIMAFGLILNHRMIKEETENENENEDIETTEDVSDVEVELTPNDIADKFERHFMRTGRAYIRARKLQKMFNCEIDYCEKNSSPQKIILKDGQIENGKLSIGSAVETYDRIRVLLTELERVKEQNGSVTINYLS